MTLVLRPPTLADVNAFKQIAGTEIRDNQTFLLNYTPGMSFEDFVQICDDHSQGKNLPPNYVPATFFFGFVGNEIVGRLSIRWELNDFLTKVGGHIGYAVIPKQQGKGYATEMLKQALAICRKKGLDKVLLTCDDDNLASIRTIERAHGKLENIYEGPEVSTPKRRYWVETAGK